MKPKLTLQEQNALDNIDSAEWIVLHRAGHRNAFGYLTGFYTVKLTAYVRGFLRIKNEAEDRVQDVVEALFLYLMTDKYVEEQNFGGWYFTFARFVVYNLVKHQKLFSDKEDAIMEEEMLKFVIEEAICKETKEILYRVIDDLGLDDKVFFNLRFVEDMPLKELGALYGMSNDWASTKYRRILVEIKEGLIREGVNRGNFLY
jgi:RNA polymerase sigma factor (sigma-70 family)